MNFFKNLFNFGSAGIISGKENYEEKYGIKVSEDEIDLIKETEKVGRILEKYKKVAYIPIIQEVEKTFSAVSKFGGLPYLRNENDWPICPNCKKHMTLFLQLDLSQIPEKKENKLLQMFYCINSDPLCEDDLGTYEPFSEGYVIRRIDILSKSVEIQPNCEVFPEKLITSREAKDDYPSYEDYHNLGINLEFSDEFWDYAYGQDIFSPVTGDKLFGWPAWIQGAEWPSDRKTGKQMELFFQIDSEDNLPYMFGDVGTGHITQSPDNKDELTFNWACG